jgi:sirohydrochlorin cobaltochelatase
VTEALILVGHGSKDPGAEDVLPFYVDRLFRLDRFTEVIGCYLEKSPSLGDALSLVEADRILVMPLLIAPGYHTRVTIPEAIKASGKEVVLLKPLGRSEHIVRLIEERAVGTIFPQSDVHPEC